MEVIEHTDGRLQVVLNDAIIPSKPCPPRPGLMRINRADTDPDRLQRQLAMVEQLAEVVPIKRRSWRRRVASPKPTARQVARWKAVQVAKAKGMNISGTARELGLSRKTVRNYMKATEPPRNWTSRMGAISRQELREPVH